MTAVSDDHQLTHRLQSATRDVLYRLRIFVVDPLVA